MAINKVVYGNDTLMDLTNDTVEANNLLEGATAHDRSGQQVQGTAFFPFLPAHAVRQQHVHGHRMQQGGGKEAHLKPGQSAHPFFDRIL